MDTYGNAITALPAGSARDAHCALLPGGTRLPFGQFYAAVPQGSPLAIIGSSGFVELAINQGDAAKELLISAGSEVLIT